MISLSKLSNSSTVNVNNNVNVNTTDIKASYTEPTPENQDMELIQRLSQTQIKELNNKIEVLKLIIDMQRNNPLIVNKLIVADDIKLMKFIQLLTEADDVQLDADDIGEGCISKNTYRKVHAIYIIKGNKTSNLKYDYPQITKELTDLGISVKFVW